MAEILLGNQYNFLRHTILLESAGTVTVLRGRGVVLGIGPADRGPAMTPYGINGSQTSLIKSVFYSGPLATDLQTAAAQGASALYAINVRGEGYATATLAVTDSQTPGVATGTFDATGPGTWGNIPTIKIDDGDIDGFVTETLTGNGTTVPYALLYSDILHETVDTNICRVGATTKTLVYTGTPDPGEALIDPVTGKLSFATGEWPTTSQQVLVRYRYASRKITIQDEGGVPAIVYNNLRTQVAVEAALRSSTICQYTPATGITHLPETMAATPMAGGLDGRTPTVEDWQAAFNIALEELPASVYPSTVFTTTHSATQGQSDVVALMDAFLWQMSRRPIGKMKPCQGFVSLDSTWTADQMAEFRSGYTNLWMTLLTNGYDENEKNLAPARAGQEAALALGTSAATESNSLKGISGLLWQWDDNEREVLNRAGLEVLVKEDGVRPYVGVSTDTDDNFFRCVDVRTIIETIIIIDGMAHKFLNERRTLTNLGRLQSSIHLMLAELASNSVLDYFSVLVTPNASNRNGVDIAVDIQPVGHMETFNTVLRSGYISTQVAA